MLLRKLYYRIRQFAFSAFMCIAPTRDSIVIAGAGSIYKVPKLIKEQGLKKVFIITTSGFLRRGSLQAFFEAFQTENIKFIIFGEVQPDPTINCIEKAVDIYQNEHCEAIVAVGGGSVIDCAKAVGARIARPKKTLLQLQGLLKVMKKIPSIYAIPTTAGTGSEATAGAVITNGENHYKYTVLDLCLVPKYAILDAELTTTLPSSITAVTGMDALTHAIEAYTNRFASPKARKNAKVAVKLIYKNLLKAYENGNDIEARENMLLASYYAGIAINNNFVGYVHAIAHGIGGLYGVPHGKANAIILPYVLEYYGKAIEKKLAELADVAGIKGNTQKEKAKALITSVRNLNKKMGIPEKIEELKRKDFQMLVQRAVKEANPTYPVPTIWTEKEFGLVLKRLK